MTSRDSKLTFMFANMGTSTIRVMVDRLDRIEDPIVKYSLFFQIMRLFLEIGINGAQEMCNGSLEDNEEKITSLNEKTKESSLDETEKQKLKRLTKENISLDKSKTDLKYISEIFGKYLDNFEGWIKSPMYSPDHPFGSILMNENKQQFDLKQEHTTNSQERECLDVRAKQEHSKNLYESGCFNDSKQGNSTKQEHSKIKTSKTKARSEIFMKPPTQNIPPEWRS